MTWGAERLRLEANLHFDERDQPDAVLSVPARDLLNAKGARRLLTEYAACIRARTLQPAAAYFSGWLADIALAQQFFLSIGNRSLDLSLDNLQIELYQAGGYYAFSFRLHRWAESALPEDTASRMQARTRVLGKVYVGTMRPLLESLAATSSMGAGQLWGQLPSRFYTFREVLFAKAKDQDTQRRVQEDLDALRALPSAVFGRNKNPFSVRIRLIDDGADATRCIPIRTSCCLYYQTEGGQYCYTCPRLRPEQRQALRERARGG
ncbi:(2Fe-2S)-binding protein [Alicyclobacillus shizuokensis]|uniref:(2Fe-2S)-binding protein n=1 Tax=Alicyclobacillus shizuokensis TaxID=392014 RepID=UPI00082FDFBD|nr:(2Fe-2S)-binding protein [Alicyclobacillus shizuokensis]MCL6625186.1 (2Fe-2S)-binding protein [Alicyclobacillus shizuokensis]